jgi:hypothetical protein
MSLASWYLHKADQCARMAKDASEPRRRAECKENQKLWLAIANQTERDEGSQFGKEPK